jgi:hypothetical protein
MIISAFIFFLVILFALKSYHKAIILYAAIKILLQDMPFLVIFGKTILLNNLITVMFMCFSVKYFFNTNQKNVLEIPSALKRSIFLLAVSIFISSILSPIASEIFRTVQAIIANCIFTYLFWKELKSIQDIKLFIKGLFVVSNIIILYSILEWLGNGYNPYLDYIISISSEEMAFTIENNAQDIDKSRGLTIRAFFPHANHLGTYAAVILLFFYYINKRYKKIWNKPIFIKVLFMCSLLFVLMLTKSRSAVLFFAISFTFTFVFTFNFKTVLSMAVFLPLFAIPLYGFLESYYELIIKSILKPEESEAGGTSLPLLILKYVLAIQTWESRPWFGYGINSAGYLQSQGSIAGVEPLWARLLVFQGIAGVLAQLYMFYAMAKLAIGKSKFYVIGAVTGSFISTSASSELNLYFLSSLLLIAYRLELWSNNKTLEANRR